MGFENSIKNGFYLILQKLLNWSLIMQRNEKKNDDIQQLVKLFSHIKQHVKVNYIKNKLWWEGEGVGGIWSLGLSDTT